VAVAVAQVGESGVSPSPAASSSASKSSQPSPPPPQAMRCLRLAGGSSIASIFAAPAPSVMAATASALRKR
jgi:hypothetical protein